MTTARTATADTAGAAGAWDHLIRRDRVHRSVYTDPAIFAEEMVRVFGHSWVYLAHESQLPQPNSYLSLRLGQRPFLLTRDRDGKVHGIFNRCTHRGATLCREESGVAKAFPCPYHGWTFRNTGELVGVPWPEGYGPEFDKGEFNLRTLNRVESYRGFIFGTLNADAPSVADWLGPARGWLDYWIDRAPNGEVTVTKAINKMGYRGNWKLAYDNGADGYHPAFSHQSLLTLAGRLGESKDMTYFGKTPDDGPMNSYSLGNGHTVIDQRPNYTAPGDFWRNQRPQPGRERFEEQVRSRYPDDADRLLDLAIGSQINLCIFPNLLIIGNQIQVIDPLAVDHTQLTWYATTIGGVPDEINTMRMRTQEDFPAFGEPDDQVNFEEVQRGLAVPEEEWVLMNRGLDVPGWQNVLGEDGVTITKVTDELHMRSYFAEWLRLMNGVL